MVDNKRVHIVPNVDERPAQFAERVGYEYAVHSSASDKKNKGQFFTPLPISKFMGSLSGVVKKKNTSILDPGCGSGILSCSLIEHLIETSTIKNVFLTAFETDLELIPFTECVLSYLKSWCSNHDVFLSYTIHHNDFVLEKSFYIDGQDSVFFGLFDNERYDIIISNPPYFKLAKDDMRTKSCHSIVDGQTNIYALFMAISSRLLNPDGVMIFITPRSFTSGRYFQSFRNFLFKNATICFIHLFNTRKDTFAKDDVLQELVIMKLQTSSRKASDIVVSYSQGISDLDCSHQKSYPAIDIVDIASEKKIIYLPIDQRDEAILNLFRSWTGNIEKYDIQISTGPVVAFRYYDNITDEAEADTVPLYWLHNVVKMLCDHSAKKKNKGQYIRVSAETRPTLLPNKNYVLLRRLSAKDDNSRLVAAPYFGNMTQYEFVGIENKLNYIYRPKGRLKRDEVIGITALLNSDLFDAYFRTFNGNINVSATELRMMPLPPIETIREIGRKIILRNDFSLEYINDLILKYFNIR